MPSIINRIARDSFFGGKFSQAGSQSRKATASVAPADEEPDENLDLFSKNRQSLPLSSSDQTTGSAPLRRLSFTSGKVMKSGLDDLISSADKEKHDYDWLLTPPGTPLDPSSDGHVAQATVARPKRNVLARSQSVSTSNASSRLSVHQTDSNPPSRLASSSSITRSLSTTSQFSTHSSIMSSSILNTSSASVASYIRPSSPISQSFSSARPISSPSATPSRASLIPRCASSDRVSPSRNSASSAPSPRVQIPASSNAKSSASRSNSRASTPTRRIVAVPPSTLTSSMPFMTRPSSQRGSSTSRSCPSSPGPKIRPSTQMGLHDIPPNLRISLPNRALSTGRTRPGLPSVRANSEKVSSHNVRSRQFSPIAGRGRSSEPGGRGPPTFNEHGNITMARRIPVAPESTMRKPGTGKSSANSVSENNEFQRTISRKSMDMSVRNMDNKMSPGRVQSVSGGILYPRSMCPAAASKSQVARTSSTSISGGNRIKVVGNRENNSENGFHTRSLSMLSKEFQEPTSSTSISGGNRIKIVGNRENNSENGFHTRSLSMLSKEFQEPDIFENYRHDASLLVEDLRSTNWLRGFEDNSDDCGIMFDSGLDLLPEPFGPL